MQAFSEKGYYGTTLNGIASELGIKKASLYNYINSKDDLYSLCLKTCVEESFSIIEEINPSADNLEEELLTFFQKYIYGSKSDTILQFYVQLSFSPPKFIKDVERYNFYLSKGLTERLFDLHRHFNLKMKKEDFVLLVRMFLNGWIYRRAFLKSAVTQYTIKNEFKLHCDTFLDQIK